MRPALTARLIAALLCGALLDASASDESHAAPAAKPATAPAPAAPAPAVPAAAASAATASAKSPAATAAAPPVAATPAAGTGGDAKARPTATPAQVSARIAEKLAILRAAKELAAQEARPRRAPGPVRRKPAADAAPAAPLAGRELAGAHVPRHWSYGGEDGPIRWAEMNPDWAKCGSGNRQSPIDIRSGIKVDLEPIAFDYKPSGFSIIDNGHTIQVNLGAGNHITVQNRMYELVQFHFHRPSEEKINGRAYDMVAHLVHKDAAGKLAVVAVLIERGAARSLIQTVWNNLPLEKNEVVTPNGSLDMNAILPARREYFTYMGSLTTPPCSEGVLWMVMKEPVSVSQEQLDIFARLYQMNARPIQGTAERLIKESN